MNKKLFIAILVAVSLLCAACGGNANDVKQITGKYTLTKMSTESITADQEMLEMIGYGESFLELTDGKFVMAVGDDKRTGSYEKNENELVMTADSDSAELKVISMEGKVIKLDLLDGFVCTFTKE